MKRATYAVSLAVVLIVGTIFITRGRGDEGNVKPVYSPVIVARLAFTKEVSAIPETTLFTPEADEFIRIETYSGLTAVGAQGGYTGFITWTDNNATTTSTWYGVGGCFTDIHCVGGGTMNLRVKAHTPVTFHTVLDPSSGSFEYEFLVTIERL
jgi:hypothetical protein